MQGDTSRPLKSGNSTVSAKKLGYSSMPIIWSWLKKGIQIFNRQDPAYNPK